MRVDRLLRHALLLGLLLGLLTLASLAQAQLLWISTDVTPAAREALLVREAQAAGISLQRWQVPLQAEALGDRERQARQRQLQGLVQAARWVWIDAPHAVAETRLRGLLADLPGLDARPPLWIPGGEPPATERSLRALLQAGGAANTRAALQVLKAQADGRKMDMPLAQRLPLRGFYHPDAPALLPDADAARRWADQRIHGGVRKRVVILLHRYHFVQGQTAWLDAWLRQFEAQGLQALAAFVSPLDETQLQALLAPEGQPLHDVLVTHTLMPKAGSLQTLFERWGRPVLATLPFRQGDSAQWDAGSTGLAQSDIPFYLAQPESAGLIDPVLVVAHPAGGAEPQLIERQSAAVVAKARRLIALQDKPAADKRLSLFVYNYPAGASNFGASFLNVPRSLEQLSRGLQAAGYAVEPRDEAQWLQGLQGLLAAYYPGADLDALLRSGQAAALPVADYQRWFDTLPATVRQPLLQRWGPPAQSRYVRQHQGKPVFVIPRLQLGHLAVLPQPPREEDQHLGRDAMQHRSKTPLSHHYLAVYLWARQADALIHFGTHGTQEWANGKLRGLDVHDDALLPLGDVPVIYPYIVDNLGEALTAKRRGRALMVSHRTPSFAPAGFNARMARMHELMHEWETVDPGPTRQGLERQMVEQFVEHQLHKDLGWTAEQIAANFSGFLELLHPYLDRLAQSSQPQGLAVFGRVPDEAQRRGTLLQMLRAPLIEALGEDIDEAFLIDYERVATARPARWLDLALQDARAASELDLRPAQPDGPVPNHAARKPIDSAALYQLALRAQEMERRLSHEGELPGLLAALEGRFVPAAYGGDPLRNPDSLPTGRNLSGLDPARLPTPQAYEAAQRLFRQWWAEQVKGPKPPQRLALSLWAGETLRHQGLMEAQALAALGVEPVWDENGRPTKLRLIPLAALGHARIDVLLSITGSYRDQFPGLMKLLDEAVALAASAAEQEGDNAITRHSREVEQELRRQGMKPAQARQLAQARMFGNSAGAYGTGVAEAMQADALKREDPRLGGLFLQSMSQPYVKGEPLAVDERTARSAFAAQLKRTDAALMSRSSHLYAMLSSDDPFQYLGGLAAAAKAAGRKEALQLHVSQLQDAAEQQTESASRAIALEMQGRYLHPGWLKAQRDEGYAGALQVLKTVQFTLGWQNMAPETVRPDHWQSLFDVLVRDKHQLQLPQWLAQHRESYAQTLAGLVRAAAQGHWQPDAATRRELAQRYAELRSARSRPDELAGVQRWVQGQLPRPPAPAPRPATPKPHQTNEWSQPPVVRGLQLQPVPQVQPPRLAGPSPLSTALAWVLMGLLMACGASWRWFRAAPSLNSTGAAALPA